MPMWLYALACVVVPGVWGVIMFYVFNAVGRRRALREQRDRPPPIDYTI